LQEASDVTGRGARSVEDLPPPNAHRAEPVDRGLEVPLEVGVPAAARGVAQTAVELDYLPEVLVHHVPVERAPARVAHLATSRRETMGSLDPRQVAVLQDGAGALVHVAQDAGEELPAGQARAGRRRVEQPLGRRPPSLDGIGERRHRGDVVPRLGGHVHEGVLNAHPRR
jgi:hypothetical protein